MENRGLLLPWSRWACNARSWAVLPFASVWKRVCLKNKRPCSFCGTMAFYQERIIPWLIHLSMRQGMLAPYRDRVYRVREVESNRSQSALLCQRSDGDHRPRPVAKALRNGKQGGAKNSDPATAS